jgi:hypothetical protein
MKKMIDLSIFKDSYLTNARRFGQKCIGLSLEEAEKECKDNNYDFRIIQNNTERYYKKNRLNFKVENNIIVEFYKIG